MTKRALISVSDKTGVVDLARRLVTLGFDIISTGGTFKALKDAKVPVTRVEDVTGFPEMLDGRIKTLHPAVHGGILARRDRRDHMNAISALDITPIDLVIVNLYPFEAAVEKDPSLENAVENIDIGGPSMVRAAAKNSDAVTVVVDPGRYDQVIESYERYNEVQMPLRRELMVEAFAHTAWYDAAIDQFFRNIYGLKDPLPKRFLQRYEKVQDLRYGENKEQRAAYYRIMGVKGGMPSANVLHGKELSFNNILDLEDTWALLRDFEAPAAAVIKHTNPCGVAIRGSISEAYKDAHSVDPKSAFGGVVGLNRTVDIATAQQINETFKECVIAPGYDKDALEMLKKKANIRLLEMVDFYHRPEEMEFKKVAGGLLLEDGIVAPLKIEELKVVTKKQPATEELKDMQFAWTVVRHVKSNAIVFAKNLRTTGIGAGQMSRVDSVDIALRKSGGECNGSVMASDAFFPFRDAIDVAAQAGITAIIHPGGSIRDKEVIDAADQYGMAMVFTGIRCFKH